jgi:hypothetical protein
MQKRFIKFISIVMFTTVVPLVTFAANAVPRTGGSGNYPSGGSGGVLYDCDISSGLSFLLCRVAQLLANVVPVLIALGVVYFVWGVITYVVGSDEEAKTTGRDRMIFGIIGLAVILSMWGLTRIVTNTFRTESPGPSSSELQRLVPRY